VNGYLSCEWENLPSGKQTDKSGSLKNKKPLEEPSAPQAAYA